MVCHCFSIWSKEVFVLVFLGIVTDTALGCYILDGNKVAECQFLSKQ